MNIFPMHDTFPSETKMDWTKKIGLDKNRIGRKALDQNQMDGKVLDENWAHDYELELNPLTDLNCQAMI